MFPLSAIASPSFSNIVAFGDSLSDNGNVYNATGYSSPYFPEYYPGRFSNGLVWVEYLAFGLHASLDNRAWGGATTSGYGNASVPGLNLQVASFTGLAAPENTLFSVWAGPNDFFQGSSDWQVSVDNIVDALDSLVGKGAKHILVPNMPNIGATPHGIKTNMESSWGPLTDNFNGYLAEQLMSLSKKYNDAGVTFYDLDVDNIFTNIASSEFLNVTDSCYADNLPNIAWSGASDTYLFWDSVHPTTKAHAFLAEYAELALETPISTPVPAAVWLLGSGLIGLAGLRKRFAN